ncbi:MAG: putative repeat protein (TIGR04138 family), partial [Planctomycetota bacterium]
MNDAFQELAVRDGRFSVEAFRFLYESLEEALHLAGKDGADGLERHLTGQEVLVGMRSIAGRMFGPMAAQVWRSWGVHESMDWGRIVFLLVDEELLSRREEDSIEDFREGFDFDAVFVENYSVSLP